MNKEVYDLFCNGEIAAGFSKATVIPNIVKLLQIDENNAAKFANGKPLRFKKNISWQQAQHYYDEFKSIGINIHIDLVLNAEIFRSGIVAANDIGVESQHVSVSKKITNKSTKTLTVKLSRLAPFLFSTPIKTTLFDNHNNAFFELQSYNHTFNSKALLILAMFIALVVQRYLLLLMVQMGTGMAVTVTSIVFFVFLILYVPKIVCPNRVFTLRYAQSGLPQYGDAYLLCTQTNNINPFTRQYQVYASNNDTIATIYHNKMRHLWRCLDCNGNVLFTSSEENDVDDVTRDIASEIRDEIYDLGVLSYFKTFTRMLRKIMSWLGIESAGLKQCDFMVVRDNKQNKVAFYHRAKIGIIEIPENSDGDKNKEIITAFLLVCLGVS